jgi:hypothetical protein
MADSTAWDQEFEGAPNAPELEWEEAPVDPIRVQQDIHTLARVGYLQDAFPIFGHSVTLRTLTIGEELDAALAISRYENTLDANRAWKAALVAASIISEDGRVLTRALGPEDNLTRIQRQVAWVLEHWHWITIDEIYNGAYLPLQERVIEAAKQLKKA